MTAMKSLQLNCFIFCCDFDQNMSFERLKAVYTSLFYGLDSWVKFCQFVLFRNGLSISSSDFDFDFDSYSDSDSCIIFFDGHKFDGISTPRINHELPFLSCLKTFSCLDD